jgi:hypothetical protein
VGLLLVPGPRRAGSPWRILVHEYAGERKAYDVSNDPAAPGRHAETTRRLNEMRPDLPPSEEATAVTVLAGTEFDELVVGKWIHLEQMDTGRWWMNVGGVTVNISADRDGRPRRVSVYGPGDYAEPEEGCTYEVEWSAED